MKYRNIHNGRIIEISSKLTSPDWVEVSNEKKQPAKVVEKNERKKEVRRSK